MPLRYIKILLSMSVAAWGLIAGAVNLIYYNYRGVSVVMSMQGEDSIRAISIPALYAVGYAFIYLGKFATGFACAWGTYKLWAARTASPGEFHRAKTTTLFGCGIAMFMLFFGFVVIAGSYFNPGPDVSREVSLAFHQFALFYMGGIGLIALFISAREPDE